MTIISQRAHRHPVKSIISGNTLSVKCSNSVHNLSEIEQSAAELLMI